MGEKINMADKPIFLVLGIVCIAMLTGWIFSLSSQPDVTMRSVMKDYDASNGVYSTGTQISNTPTQGDSSIGNMFGFALEIPILGQLLSFLSFVITSVYGMLYNVAMIPSYFPGWMMPVFVMVFFAFVSFIYLTYKPM
jgi:hypothetical protein